MTDWILYSFEKPAQNVALPGAKKTKWADVGDVTSWEPTGEEIPKGTCPTCGKHIGKGIAMHKKACKG